MRLSEIEDDRAFDVLADIIDPLSEICADKSVIDGFRKNRLGGVKLLLKSHRKSIIEIFAAIEGVPVSEYKINLITLPLKILEALNDPQLVELFTSATPTGGATSSGVALENTD